jgi:hypothetical protein
MIIAIDFDGTCTTHDYPNIGKDIGAVPVIQKLAKEGHQLILWTMRSDKTLQDAIDWFKRNNIELVAANENPTQKRWTNSPKAYAQLYIDDAALGAPLCYDEEFHSRPFVDWKKVELMLRERGILITENI